MRRIETSDDLAEGAAHLRRVEPRFEAALAMAGPPPLRRRPGGFAALIMLLCEQQVSVASGRAIFARLDGAGALSPAAILAESQPALCALGLSRPKARYAQAIAAAVQSGALCFDRLHGAPDAEAMAELTAVTGIGRWTAEVYLMFCDGRPDLMPVGDIALQEAAKVLFGLDQRPKAAVFDALAAPWAPWRSVAARVLWSYYRVIKNREGKA